MTRDEDVRAMELATQLVLGPLSGVDIIAIRAAGDAIVAILDETEVAETIRAVGELLEAVTERDRKAIENGERWGRRSRALSQDEARRVLRGLTMDQLDVLADRSGHSLHELFEWSCGQREIHFGALWLLGQPDEMAKITGGER